MAADSKLMGSLSIESYRSVFDSLNLKVVKVPQSATAKQLVREHLRQCPDPESPKHIVDLSAAIRQYQLFRRCLPRVRPHYAVKCNPSPFLVKLLGTLGTGFDCASRKEIELVIRECAFTPSQAAELIIFANPVKQISHIKSARSMGVKRCTFDNKEEIKKLAEHWPETEVVLRLAPDDSQSLSPFSSKFGAHLQQCDELIAETIAAGLKLVGVSFHVGSQCFSADAYVKALKDSRAVFDMAEKRGLHLTFLDIGGGFPGDANHDPSFETIAAAIGPELERLFAADVQVIAEPGRFFACPTHLMIVNVFAKRDVKPGLPVPHLHVHHAPHPEQADNPYIQPEDLTPPEVLLYVNDGIYGSLNCILTDHVPFVYRYIVPEEIFDNPPVESEKEFYEGQPTRLTTFFGPTCDSLDKLATAIPAPPLRVGDWLFFENFGAYTTSVSTNFNGLAIEDFSFIWRE